VDEILPTPAAQGEDVPLPELLELLRLCVSRVETSIPQMRFGADDPTDRYAVALLLAITDYARGVITAGAARTFAGIPGATRSTLDAYVDIANLCDHPDYWKHLEAADASSWSKVLQTASRGGNPFLKSVRESEYLEPGRSYYAQKLKQLASSGVKKLDINQRFEQAGLKNEYESAYTLISAESHNNVSSLISRYYDLASDRIMLRQPERANIRPPHYELPCTLLMSEILLRSAEKVLRHCGHGIAVLSEANERFAAIAAVVMGTNMAADSTREGAAAASPKA
jgi:hypothetical protein